MTFHPILALHQALGTLFLLCLGTVAVAQPAPTSKNPNAAEPSGRHNQKIEHLVNEDRGSRIDELRAGGVTQSISVQPKNDMPAYEVRPQHSERSDAQPAGAPSAGARVWNLLKF